MLHRSPSCVHAVANTPAELPRAFFALFSPEVAAFPVVSSSRLPHHNFRGLLSVHSRYGLYTRQVPFRTLFTEGFSRFVTSAAAPIATGWSDSCRAGFPPARKPCLCTAHETVFYCDTSPFHRFFWIFPPRFWVLELYSQGLISSWRLKNLIVAPSEVLTPFTACSNSSGGL